MIPSWVINALLIFVGCIVACWLGSALPVEDGLLPAYILGLVIVCTICAVTNNFPMLLVLGIWTPMSLPVPVFRTFPTFAIILVWIGLMLLFRVAIRGSLPYVRSFNVFLLICFSWVVIRFLMSPIHKLGASVEGGSGVSGAMPYFLYVLAAATLVSLGAILNTREKLVLYMRWSLRIVFVVGVALLICAFIPATAPYLIAMGMFKAGNMGDGIQRLVVLPGYGLFLAQASLCPDLFRLNKKQSAVILLLGLAMIVVGGNRGSVAAAIIALPVILFLRRKTLALILLVCAMIFGVGMLRLTVDQMDTAQIPMLLRSFGIFSSKIDDASGGSASAKWRYAVWQSGIEKIEENPLTGKGFGNLPEHLDPSDAKVSTDFEVVLAGGEAHNGFVTAAYAFGIPFMAGLTAVILLRLVSHAKSALTTDKHDRELRDLHVMLASLFASFPLIIYSALDLSLTELWLYVGLGIILDHLPRRSSTLDLPSVVQPKFQSQMAST